MPICFMNLIDLLPLAPAVECMFEKHYQELLM